MGYTLRQFNAYLELADKRERAALRWSLIAPAAAQGDGKALKTLLDKLKD